MGAGTVRNRGCSLRLVSMVMDNTQRRSDRSLHVHVIMWKTLFYAPRVGKWWWKTLRAWRYALERREFNIIRRETDNRCVNERGADSREVVLQGGNEMEKVGGYKYFRSTVLSRLLGGYSTGVRKVVQASRIE